MDRNDAQDVCAHDPSAITHTVAVSQNVDRLFLVHTHTHTDWLILSISAATVPEFLYWYRLSHFGTLLWNVFEGLYIFKTFADLSFSAQDKRCIIIIIIIFVAAQEHQLD